ncbi:unnamed protein product, partial [Chrysoparadoxa australica]
SKIALGVYPNPVVNWLTITSDHFLEEINVYSMTGELIHAFRSKSNLAMIDCSSWPPGTYSLIAITAEGRVAMPFVKR